MQQKLSSEANDRLARKEVLHILQNPKVSTIPLLVPIKFSKTYLLSLLCVADNTIRCTQDEEAITICIIICLILPVHF
jgi:hypothetical protein